MFSFALEHKSRKRRGHEVAGLKQQQQFFNRKAYENLLLMDFNWILLYYSFCFQHDDVAYIENPQQHDRGEGEKFNLVGTFPLYAT